MLSHSAGLIHVFGPRKGGLGHLSRKLAQAFSCGVGRVHSSKRECRLQYSCSFEASAHAMFANVPLAKVSHIAKSKVNVRGRGLCKGMVLGKCQMLGVINITICHRK